MLERRRRIDQALYAVVMEAYVHGVSTRKVDDLVGALGVDAGISKSEVSRICANLDEEMTAFRGRDLSHLGFVYLLCDATYVKARVAGRVVSRAVVVATGVAEDATREVLDIAIGDSEDAAFGPSSSRVFRPRSPRRPARGQRRAPGAEGVIAKVFPGASWLGVVAFLHNVLVKVPRTQQSMVAAMIRTVFAQPDAKHVERQVKSGRDHAATVPDRHRDAFEDASEDVTAFRHFGEPLAEDLVDQLARTSQRRDQATHQRRWHLSQRRRRAATHHRRVRGSPRRVERLRATLPDQESMDLLKVEPERTPRAIAKAK